MTTYEYHPAVLLDLDGTLVDSVFQHVVTWHAALREHGYDVPQWRIHAGIGMGGQRLVPWLLGGTVADADAISDKHRRYFLDMADGLRPTNGAQRLLEDLEHRQVDHLIATSAESEVGEALLTALGRTDLATADADDVGSPKPAPDLLLASCEKLGVRPDQATLLGDSPWDAEAAQRAGVRAVAVRTGGFGDDRLLAAGASAVEDDPAALIGRL